MQNYIVEHHKIIFLFHMNFVLCNLHLKISQNWITSTYTLTIYIRHVSEESYLFCWQKLFFILLKVQILSIDNFQLLQLGIDRPSFLATLNWSRLQYSCNTAAKFLISSHLTSANVLSLFVCFCGGVCWSNPNISSLPLCFDWLFGSLLMKIQRYLMNCFPKSLRFFRFSAMSFVLHSVCLKSLMSHPHTNGGQD